VDRSWAVVRSQPRREPLASEALHARGVETYIPRMPAESLSGNSRSLFPGYLFAHVVPHSDDLLRIRSAPGVAYLLPRASAPALLSDALVSAIRAREEELRRHSGRGGLVRGDRVRVRSGPFRLVEASFDRRLSATGRVRILLELVHGVVPVQTRAANLEVIGRG
jgi:transcription antitermination factor NusG